MLPEILNTLEPSVEALLRQIHLFSDDKIDRIPIAKALQMKFFRK